jgi:hypothetical protein
MMARQVHRKVQRGGHMYIPIGLVILILIILFLIYR